jgi:hypothetical protein
VQDYFPFIEPYFGTADVHSDRIGNDLQQHVDVVVQFFSAVLLHHVPARLNRFLNGFDALFVCSFDGFELTGVAIPFVFHFGPHFGQP